MKIQVKSGDHSISIPIPTRLIFGKSSVKIYLKLAKRFSGRAKRHISDQREEKLESLLDQLPEDAIFALCNEIVRIKKKHGSWKLVEVCSADGDIVNITL